jgi:hypothetical protein
MCHRCRISRNWLQLPCAFLIDCGIVRCVPTLMSLLLNKVRVWLATASVRTSSALLLILAVFIWNVEVWKPATFFDRYQDHAIYFSSSQALAQHQGYVLPSFPGVPLQPKYPVLHPLLLSGVWKAWPEFPNNVIWAIRLTECFWCLALLRTFFLLRCVAGQSSTADPHG